MKKNQQGFGSITMVLAVVIIGLILAVGWLVFDRQKNNKAKIADTPATQQEQKQETSKKEADTKTPTTQTSQPTPEPTTTVQYIGGVAMTFSKEFGNVLAYSRGGTGGYYNISSDKLLAKEKETSGQDAELFCTANEYPLGEVTIKDSSLEPVGGATFTKKLADGRYLFYQDASKVADCYTRRPAMQSFIVRQVELLKEGLQTAK